MNPKINKRTIIQHLGLVDYQEAWDYQTELFNEIIQQKIENRNLSIEQQKPTPNYLLFCQHPHVYTLGKSGDEKNLLLNEKQLEEKSATFYRINRGGDITYHGPGQLVGYPILDLDNFFTDIHKYLRLIEQAVINTLEHYNIKSGRVEGLTGVWLDGDDPAKARKICALGVKTSRWVTMHGFAFNINSDLDYFNNIIPCGISDKAVTSLQQEIGIPVDFEEAKEIVKKELVKLFEMEVAHEERHQNT
ncbi:MAG: lipoyl(octanoyl) transferase LipB [Candidatus Cyclobacteriaceae bacterium M2_1C_046]